MNTSKLKSFAPAVRRQLMEAVGRKLDYVLTADTPDLRQAASQVAALRREAGKDRAGLIDRVAYTWFNRLAALRFLDARGWHPFKARVLTPATAEETQPEILKLLRAASLPAELHAHTNLQRLNDLLDGRLPTAIAGADPQGEAYRGLILASCRFYHDLLPDVFDKLNDESELLLPDDLLTATSVAEGFRTEISDEDCSEVEILGWLYQFYISEKKDAVMARKSAVPTEDIPAVTQLFTPHWIVRYIVENSLGRLWLLNRPHSKLREHMPYYIEGEAETDFLRIASPEDIKLVDLACGSAHMLTYAFDLLYLIYEEEGYAANEIPGLILKHNLFGLEICPRAAQLAVLALVFKAREKSRRFFQPEHIVRPNIIELKDIRFDEGELADYFKALNLDPSSLNLHPSSLIFSQFEESKNFGSLIQPCLTEAEIQSIRLQIQNSKSIIQNSDLMVASTHLKVLRVLEQAEALTQRYHVVVANPPYMGSGNFNPALRIFLEGKYKVTRTDLFAIFLERTFDFVFENGMLGMVTMQSWMFTTSYRELREKILANYQIQTLAQLGARGFDSISGEIVATAAFCITRTKPTTKHSTFIRLTDGNAEDKHQALLRGDNRFAFDQRHFKRIPGSPMVYWKGTQLIEVYETFPVVGALASFREGIHTGDNPRFLRQWWEVPRAKMSLSERSYASLDASEAKWIPYNKGGGCVRWYGNFEYVLAFDNASREAMALLSGHVRPSQNLYFKRGGTWSDVGTKGFGVKYYPEGFLFADKGPVVVGEEVEVLIAGLNSAPFTYMCELLMPTISYRCGTVKTIPFPSELDKIRVFEISTGAIDISRADWDNFETSWDFKELPLLRNYEVGIMKYEGEEKSADSNFILHTSSFILKGATLEESWTNWNRYCTAAIRRMQELETENNRLFIAAYGLEGELQPEVPEEQITLARADARRDMAAFLSYAVGVMFGRYSLEVPGLVLADAGGTVEDYWQIVRTRKDELGMMNDENEDKEPAASANSDFIIHNSSFILDQDGIIPVLDGEWFEDDIVARTREFLRATFGEATLKQNLRFIEDSLGKPLDKYFLTDFYKDHLQTYKKRPIYWLFQSPKKGFSALFYLHRYTKDTANTLLNKYLRDYLKKLENRIAHLTEVEATATATKDKTAARKEREKLQKSLKDCQDWERDTLLPLAQQRLEIDLDDGVKTNYLKFQGAVQPIPGLAAKEE